MQKRRFILILIGVVVLAGVIVLVFRPEPEPEYGGKKLSEWVVELPAMDDNRHRESEAAQAVLRIGTNAIPFLLEWLCWEPSALRIKLQAPVDKIFTKLSPASLKRSHRPYDRRWGAARSFRLFGPVASGAIPELNRRMIDPKRRQSGQIAAACLTNLGTNAVPPLMSALTNENAEVRGRAAVNMEYLGTNAAPAVPLLIECLQDTDQMVVWGASKALIHFKHDTRVLPALADCVRNSRQTYRGYAIIALGRFGREALPVLPVLLDCLKDPNVVIAHMAGIELGNLHLEASLVVPALAQNLQHSNAQVRLGATIGLEQYGEEARSAVPALLKLLNDPDWNARQTVKNAILKIDPQVLEKATAQ